MNTSVSSRPLSFIPFLAADAALLLTAAVIAWRTPEELAGGALFGVVFCVGLGAVLTVLPFLVNDARERDDALAARQRELTELVNTSTASASRWGTQWASAATGLEDAATLASRSIAAAERLPAVFQEKADALAHTLAQAESEARARAETAGRQETTLAARIAQIESASAALQRTLADFERVQADLREQRAAIGATLAEFPAAAGRAQAATAELEERIAAAPARIEEQVARLASEAGIRLGETTAALTTRLTGMEATVGFLLEELKRAAEAPRPEPVSPVGEEILPRLAAMEAALASLVAQGARVASAPVAEVLAAPVVTAAAGEVRSPQPVVSVECKPAAAAVRSEMIMDPFLIPADGYAALAEAIDAARG